MSSRRDFAVAEEDKRNIMSVFHKVDFCYILVRGI